MLRPRRSCFVLLLLVSGSMLVSCDEIDALRREKQIKTYWALTRAGIELTELSRNRPLTPAMLEATVRRHLSDKRDFWGNQVLILTKRTDAHVASYVLVSFGSDGRLDHDQQEEYFKLQPHSVRTSMALDVIVRDGQPISLAGK
jgi:hypothetical protein